MDNLKKTITLIMPDGLGNVLSEGNGQWQNLQLMLARSQCKSLDLEPLNYALKLLGVEKPESLAAIKLNNAGYSLEDNWVCSVDLTNMQPNRDHISIVKCEFSDLLIEEAELFQSDLDNYFEEDGIKFYMLSQEEWVCILPQEMSLPTVSASEIVGQNILNFIPQWRTNSSFRKLLSDTQMMLHHSRGNLLRSQSGKVEINSIWLHNIGQLPVQVILKIDSIYCNDKVINAAANFMGVSMSNDFENLSNKNGTHILIYASPDEIQSINNPNLFTQFFEELKTHSLDCVNFIFNDSKVYTVTSADLRKFWKRRFDLKRLRKR